MANRDSDAAASLASQSKRPTVNQHDSDSQASDHGGHNQHHAQHHHRPKAQKHVVGGGGRLHARVPSSKALHKSHGSTSTTAKLTRRQVSPASLDRTAAAVPPAATSHRRATSDVSPSRDSSLANLKKNSSHTSLKRNRSKVEVGKKSKSSTNLKRSPSNLTVHKHKSSNHQVHFNLGGDGEDDNHEDEWVDAGTSASPLLSRRTSVVSGGQLSANPSAASSIANSAHSRPRHPPDQSQEVGEHRAPTSGTDSVAHSPDRDTTNHKQYLTNRVLRRIPSEVAPPKMSAEVVSIRPPSTRQHSPDSGDSRGTGSTLSGTPKLPSHSHMHVQSSSSGKAELKTSRFLGAAGSQDSSSAAGGDSYLEAAHRGALARAANGRIEASALPPRPKSMGNLTQAQNQTHQQDMWRAESQHMGADDSDDESESGGAYVARIRNRRHGGYIAPRGEISRTQQKLNLQRASSSLEPTIPHPGMGLGLVGVPVTAGPLVSGNGYENRDPRLPKLLERTGMEYLIVRRYQNPIARSIARLARIPGANKGQQIPKPGSVRTHSRQGSEYASGRPGPVQSLREREIRDPHVAGLMSGQAGQRPSTPRSGYAPAMRAMGGSPGAGVEDTDEDNRRLHEDSTGLSGSSLVDHGEDAATLAILRNLWDKNMDLSASQE